MSPKKRRIQGSRVHFRSMMSDAMIIRCGCLDTPRIEGKAIYAEEVACGKKGWMGNC